MRKKGMRSIRCEQCKHFIIAKAGEGKIYGCDRSKCVFQPTTKNDLGVDCISRKAAEDITWQDPSYTDPLNILTEVRDKIRELPSVTPQEPFINKPCVSSGVCEHDKNEVLDKIRAEIEQKIEQERFARSVFRGEEKDAVNAEQCTGSIFAYNNVIELIDKYKAESEDKE